ncbi:MAG TPA: hypothetical protein VK842_05200 [bacterium]|nr:hypothetical protein [bacterium]
MPPTLLLLTPVLALAALLAWQYSLELPQVFLPPAPPSRPGLWMMSHRAHRSLPLQHLFLRLTPQDQSWAQRRPDLFCHLDDAGLVYATLGAGPEPREAKHRKLALAYNRPTDLGDPISLEERLPVDGPTAENAAIEALLAAAARYRNHLPFVAWSQISGKGYNCNSLMAALCEDTGLPMARFATWFLVCPGIYLRVPRIEFDVDQLN